MNEKALIAEAQNGDVSAMKKLAKYYQSKTKLIPPDKLNDVIWMEDYRKRTQAPDMDEIDKKYKALAYKYYRMAAEAGDAESMTKVASFLYDAIGVEKNQEEAYEWYRRGAQAGDPAAMRVTAYISEDEKDKFKWYKLSAELDKPGLNKQDSIKQTAINYACGRGTDKDLAAAEEWLAKLNKDDESSARMEIAKITGDKSWLAQAAESSPKAMIEMAEIFVGKGDFVNALTWYKKAAKNGSPDAMSIVGDIYYIGEDGIEQSYSEAFKWYRRAAARGYNMAKIKMTLMIYRGRGVKQDLQYAFKNFSEISWTQEKFFGPFRFNSVARYYAAKMRADGEGCTKDFVDAFERYKVAGGLERINSYESARSIPKAIYKVADAYFLGEGVQQNFAKALNFYKKTFTQGDGKTPYHREAVKKIAWMYELGEGIPQDKIKAAEWREKLGNKA